MNLRKLLLSFSLVILFSHSSGHILVGHAYEREGSIDKHNAWVDGYMIDELDNQTEIHGSLLLEKSISSISEMRSTCLEMNTENSEIESCLKAFDEKEPAYISEYGYSKFSDKSIDNILNYSMNELIAVVYLEHPPIERIPNLMLQNHLLIEFGVVSREELKKSFIKQRGIDIKDYQQLYEKELNSIHGVKVLRWMNYSMIALVDISPESIDTLEEMEFVKKVIIEEANEDGKAFPTYDAQNILEHMQMHDNYYVKDNGSAFYDGEWNSENGSWSELTAAWIDIHGFNKNHVVFRDWTNSSSRVNGSYYCYYNASPACTSGGTAESNHGTQCASLMLGDLRDGQDSSISVASMRRRRSGVSPESGIIFYDPHNLYTNATYNDMLDHAYGQGVDLAGSSYGNNSYACGGNSAAAQAINEQYKNGFLNVIAAGNEGHTGTCSVLSPADATAALTVGGLGNNTIDNSVSYWDNSNIRSSSSQGFHNYVGGRYRTIIDLMAPATSKYWPKYDVNSGYNSYGYTIEGGTSFSAPRVAGALLNFMHHAFSNNAQTIHLPGVQKTVMMLMGDRAYGSGSSHKTAGFSSYWGAGRTKMLRPDSVGLDSPWDFRYGYACVGQGESVYYNIFSGNTVSSDVDECKAVSWWYTDSFSNPTPNLVFMYLQYESSPNVWTTVKSSTYNDLKQRVYASGSQIQSRKLRLRFYGYDINDDHDDGGSCGANKARVYFAYICQDGDRDDSTPTNFDDIDPI